MAQYGKIEYWEERYNKEEEQFDWLQRWAAPNNVTTLQDNMRKYMKVEDKILIIGCGTSRMAEEMHEDGFQRITQVDWSYTAIQQQEKILQGEGMTSIINKQMDVRRLDFRNGYFDVVIDKALLDSMACGDGSAKNIHLMLSEVHRVLRPTGVYFCFSRAVEAQRKKYLKNTKFYNWKITKFPIQKPGLGTTMKNLGAPKKDDKKNYHFLYVCLKQKEPVEDSENEVVEERASSAASKRPSSAAPEEKE